MIFYLYKHTKQKNNADGKNTNSAPMFIFGGGLVGFIIGISLLLLDENQSSEAEIGLWYLAVLSSTVVCSLIGFALSGRIKKD